MKYSLVICFALLFLMFSGCKDADADSRSAIEKLKFLNFVRALENGSTFHYFTVIKVKNLNSGEIKEICTSGNFVSGALHRELNKGYNSKSATEVMSLVNARSDRYFEFRNKEALENISFFDYDPEFVESVKKKYDFDKMLKKIKENGRLSMGFENDEEMKAFAHALFNEGYLSGENACAGGSLIYVSEKDIKEKEQRIKELIELNENFNKHKNKKI